MNINEVSKKFELKNGKYYNKSNGSQASKTDMEKINEANRIYSDYRHQQNKSVLKSIYIAIKKYRNRKNVIIEQQQKEIARLNLVMKSKEKWANQYKGGSIEWNDSYFKNLDGVFNVGVDIATGKEHVINFNKNANILVGGAPGEGKTKFVQLLAYQALRCGNKIHIGDFKGGTDFISFQNKCDVVTTHKDLITVLTALDKERKRRVKLFSNIGAESLKEYNELTGENLLREYLIIDELGEAMEIIDPDINQKERKEMETIINDFIRSLARLGRAFGINLIFGTQRPDVGVLQGQTRDQFMKRVCFRAIKQTSQIVLNNPIAETIPEAAPGRCYINRSIDFDQVQVYLFKKDSVKTLVNKDRKSHLKVVNNTFEEKGPEELELDID